MARDWRPFGGRGPIVRADQRDVALKVLAIAVLAIAALAAGRALTSSNTSSTTEVAATASAAPTLTATKVSGPLAPTLPGQPTASPRPVLTATPKATKSSAASSTCPSARARVAQARRLLQHQSSLPSLTLHLRGGRPGLLGDADAEARTLTLFVRRCSQEPTLELAVVWSYEAAQFIQTEAWNSSTRSRWNQLRGSSFATSAQFKQDAASVFAFWQTGSTAYWQSPIAPPSFSRLSRLVPYLKPS